MRTPLPDQSARRMEQTPRSLAQRRLSPLILFSLLLAASSPQASAAARIEGIVRTSEGSPLANVNVALEELARGTQTAVSGHFFLDNVPAGTHTLTLTHVGYQTLRREVAVRAGETVSLSLILTGRPAEIPEVVVTGTRSPRELEKTPVQTTVIAQQEIARQGAVRLSDLLAEQTGLQLTHDHGTGVQVQGFDADYTLVLIDGEPVIGRTAGTLELDRFAVGNIEQVEIVKGPTSSLYGSEALAGVVNLITRKPEKPLALSLRSRYARFDALDLGGDLEFRRGRLGALVFFNRNSGSGYDLDPQTPVPTTPAFASYTLQPKFTYQIDNRAEFKVGTRLFREDQHSTTSIRTEAVDELVDEEAFLTEWSLAPSLALRTAPGHRWTASLYTSRYENTRSLTRRDSRLYSASDFSQSYHKTELQFDALPGAAHRFTLGGGYIRESVRTDRISSGGQTAASLFAYAQEEWPPADRWDVILSGRLDAHSDYAARFSPKIAALFSPRDGLRVRASLGSGFKAPDFRQLYLDFTNPTAGYSVYGSTTVKESIAWLQRDSQIQRLLQDPASFKQIRPEHSLSYSAGVEFDPGKSLSLRIDLFRNKVKDLIETAPVAVKSNGQNVYAYFNLDQVYTQGLEGEAEIRLGIPFSLELGYQYLKAWDEEVAGQVEASRIFKWSADGRIRPVRTSEYGGLFNRSRHSGTIKLHFRHQGLGLEGALRGLLRGRYGYADVNGNEILDDDPEYAPGYAVWNLTLTQGLQSSFALQLGADNLFDKTDPEHLPALPGRSFYAGLSKEF